MIPKPELTETKLESIYSRLRDEIRDGIMGLHHGFLNARVYDRDIEITISNIDTHNATYTVPLADWEHDPKHRLDRCETCRDNPEYHECEHMCPACADALAGAHADALLTYWTQSDTPINFSGTQPW